MSTETDQYPSELSGFFPDFDKDDIALVKQVQHFTSTTPERIYALVKATEYIVNNDIPGAFVECGVYRGGSAVVIISTLLRLNKTDRHLYLFDTFEGMTEPTSLDINYSGEKASDLLQQEMQHRYEVGSVWAYSPISDVQRVVLASGYDASKVHFVQGQVEHTIPTQAPDSIALLRLDTDWYESTRHELIHLYPLVSTNGVLLIDDYGHWQGAKKATDEYLEEHNIPLLLNRIDYSGRIGIKIQDISQRKETDVK